MPRLGGGAKQIRSCQAATTARGACHTHHGDRHHEGRRCARRGTGRGGRCTGAAVGAAAARGQSRRQNSAQQQQAATQQQQTTSAGQQAYAKARQACLEGKGYTVK